MFFEETHQLIGNSGHLHFGTSFVLEFASFPIFRVLGKEKLNAVLWGKISYQGFFGDHTELVNAIDARVLGLLHWEAEKIFRLCTVRLYQACVFSFIWGMILLVVTVLLIAL